MTVMATATDTSVHPIDRPDIELSVREVFGLDSDMKAPAFSQSSDLVPDVDNAYQLDHQTTMAILAGFAHNRRVMVQGLSLIHISEPTRPY